MANLLEERRDVQKKLKEAKEAMRSPKNLEEAKGINEVTSLRDEKIKKYKSHLESINREIEDMQVELGGVRGKSIEQRRLQKELRAEERTLARQQRELLNSFKRMRKDRELRENKRQLRELKVEKARLEENQKLTPEEAEAL